MKAILRPLPVLFACQGCPAFGQAARDAAALLDARGYAEMAWLGGGADEGTLASRARSRYPVYALDACHERCAERWLRGQGAEAERGFVLAPEEAAKPALAAERIAAST